MNPDNRPLVERDKVGILRAIDNAESRCRSVERPFLYIVVFCILMQSCSEKPCPICKEHEGCAQTK